MDRWATSSLKATPSSDTYEVGMSVFTRHASGIGLSFFAPLHYEPNYAYPLLVWLHDEGHSETHLRKIMPFISLRNYVAAGVRGTCPVRQGGTRVPGYTWFQTSDQISAAEDRLFEAIAAAQNRYNIASHRIFVAGIGTGGTMAIRLGLRNPARFAGVISINGPAPDQLGPLHSLPALKALPLMICRGRESERYPSETIYDDLRRLRSIGTNSITVLECHPCGDEIHAEMLAGIDRWVMTQILPQPVDADASLDP